MGAPRRAPDRRAHPRVDVVGRPPAGVGAGTVRAAARRALLALGLERASLTVRFASDPTVRGFNRRFRGVDRPTDVLSFPIGEGAPAGETGERFLGDLLLSRERALAQARRSGLTARREVEELVLHGLLHLLGHDHEADHGEMDALEIALRRRLLDPTPDGARSRARVAARR